MTSLLACRFDRQNDTLAAARCARFCVCDGEDVLCADRDGRNRLIEVSIGGLMVATFVAHNKIVGRNQYSATGDRLRHHSGHMSTTTTVGEEVNVQCGK